jgi:hypothetical protein
MADHYQQQQQQQQQQPPLLFGAAAAGTGKQSKGQQQQQQQQRVIVHIDMDCFFAAVSTVGRPEFAGGWVVGLPLCCDVLAVGILPGCL